MCRSKTISLLGDGLGASKRDPCEMRGPDSEVIAQSEMQRARHQAELAAAVFI